MTILPKKKSSQAKNNNNNNDVGVGGSVGDSSGAGLDPSANHHHQNAMGVVSMVVVNGNQSHGTMDQHQHGRYVGTSSLGGGGRTSPPSSARWHGQNHTSVPGGVGSNTIMDGGVVVGGGVGGVGGGTGVGGGGNGGPGGALIGPVGPNSSIQHKRRHRASPHRNVRKHREHRSGGGAMVNVGCSGVVGGSIGGGGGGGGGGGPSTSANAALNGVAGGSSSGGAGTSAAKNDDDDDDLTEDYSGYNSGDEYCQPHMSSEEEWAERERIFEKKMRKKGFTIKKMGEDGACLFRAVADQVYGDQEMHAVVRKHCMDYMAKNSDYFSQYVTEDFDGYLNRKRLNHIHGNHVEMQALCEMYNRSIEVFSYSTDPINTFHGIQSTDNESIRISYHKNSHYNSIVDPYKATVGVGLGLPGFMPGLAEKNLMHDAVQQSEDFHIEQTMLEDKLKATDWEATNEAIEEQVARESYLQWLRDNERRARKATTRSATATCSSSGGGGGGGGGGGASPDIRSPIGGRSPRGRPTSTPPSAANSPSRDEGGSCNVEGIAVGGASGSSNISDGSHQTGSDGNDKGVGSVTDFCLLETASFINQLPPDVFGLSEWEDADILAQVLAASQQEYLDRLKRTATEGRESSSTSSTFSKGASSSSVSTSAWQEMDMKNTIDSSENHDAMDS